MMYKEETNLWIKLWQCWKFIKKDILLSENDRFKHEYIIGHDWYWKETFILNQAIQDIENWNGFCFIDQYWDFVEGLLKYIPKERAKDVIYFDVADKERPIGLNIFDIENSDEIEFVVNETTDMFISMYWPEIFGPRIVEYFKYGSMAILEDFEDKPTIFDCVRMFTDDAYREFKMKKVKNPIVKSRWEKTYNAMWDREKQEIIPYFSSKFVQFQTNPNTRNIIWQTKSGFDMNDVMDNQKILLVNLNKWIIWDADSKLIWKILLFKISLALKKRIRGNFEDFNPFFLYLNNFPDYIWWPSYKSFLDDATRWKLWVIMSHQYGEQLKNEYSFKKETDMTQMILNTVGIICIFKLWALDSENFEREVYPKISKKNLQNLESNQWIIKMHSKPILFFVEQKAWQENNEIPSILKEYSSKKYWRRIEFIEAENRVRLWIEIDDNDLPKNNFTQEKNRYNIPKAMQENDSDLVGLILWSTSETGTKQVWFDSYPFMNEEQKWKLKDALLREKKMYHWNDWDLTQYNIPKAMQENDPDLVGLILWSTSMTTKIRQEWFDLYPFMNEEQKQKLKDILMREKKKYHWSVWETKNTD